MPEPTVCNAFGVVRAMSIHSVKNSAYGYARRVKAAGFWFFMGATFAFGATLYCGPTRIEWSTNTGLVAEIGYTDELRNQMNQLSELAVD